MGIAASLLQTEGNGAYHADIACHIIAAYTISTGYCLGELSVNVGQRNAKTVVFHFCTNLEVLAFQSCFDALIEFAYFCFTVCVG